MKVRRMLLIALTVMNVSIFAATPQVKNVKAFQQYPWGKVYISYEVVGNIATNESSWSPPFLWVTAKDISSGKTYGTVASGSPHLSGDTGTEIGLHRIIWDVGGQGVSISSNNTIFHIEYGDGLYMIIDLSSGSNASHYPVTYMATPPSTGFNIDTFKNTKLVLRYIPAGSFQMCGRYNVTLTKPFLIGIFEVTQKQYKLVMGSNPSVYTGDMRPVEKVTYNMIRGTSEGTKWPSSSAVDPTSFMGKLRMRTGLNLDLPTEAQWEYACRAGTTNIYNNGGSSVADLKILGRYKDNKSDGKGGYSEHTTVGSYLPNAWGLYDAHGNVYEWCLDWSGNLSDGIDPYGPNSNSGNNRVFRGGCWNYDKGDCSLSARNGNQVDIAWNVVGFRLAMTLTLSN